MSCRGLSTDSRIRTFYQMIRLSTDALSGSIAGSVRTAFMLEEMEFPDRTDLVYVKTYKTIEHLNSLQAGKLYMGSL